MVKVTVFVASARNGHTHRAARQFLQELQALRDVEGEVVSLAQYRLETCRGCKQCFERGEEHCPLGDERDALIAKLESSDGVVFASPNYAFHVSGLMKTFLDRIAYVLHRPRFFGKSFTSIVTQGIHGGGKIVKYFDFVAGGLGFNTVKGVCLKTLEPMSPKAARRFDTALARLAHRFDRQLDAPAFPRPGLMPLMVFRMSRTSIRRMLDANNRDWRYYADAGWFDSDYYYPVRLGPLKRAVGSTFDTLARSMAKAP
jgi:multimeric flavodoxin WrbA